MKRKRIQLKKGEHKEIHVYVFLCGGCLRNRQTKFKRIMAAGLCRKCRHDDVPKNQLSLIGGE